MKKLLFFFIISLTLTAKAQILKGFGDSITKGIGASDEQHTFLYLLAQKLGYGTNYIFYGASTSTVYLQGYTGKNFIDVSAYSLAHDAPVGYVTIMYGDNSDGNNLSPEWTNEYTSLVQNFITAGYPKDHILLMAPPWTNLFGEGLAPLRDTVAHIAANLGVTFIDLYTLAKNYIIANGENSFYNYPNEILHPNDNGNQVIADYIYSVINPQALPVKAGSLKITNNHDGTYTATFVAYKTTNTQKFRLMYSEDGKNFRPVYVFIPDKIEAEKIYSFTFKIPNQ